VLINVATGTVGFDQLANVLGTLAVAVISGPVELAIQRGQFAPCLTEGD